MKCRLCCCLLLCSLALALRAQSDIPPGAQLGPPPHVAGPAGTLLYHMNLGPAPVTVQFHQSQKPSVDFVSTSASGTHFQIHQVSDSAVVLDGATGQQISTVDRTLLDAIQQNPSGYYIELDNQSGAFKAPMVPAQQVVVMGILR